MEEYLRDPSGDNLLGLGGAKAELVAASMGVSDTLTHTHTIDCTRKWIGNAAYIVQRDVIGHPPYGHGTQEIGGSHE